MPDVAAEQRQIEDQLARLQLSLDPAVLWPDVRRESLDAALREITRATREVLARGSGTLALPGADVPPRTLGVAAFISGMGPMLGYWIGQGLVAAEPDVRALLERHYEHGRRRHALLEERLTGILDALRAHDVTPVVLKGMDTVRRYFPAPGTRAIGDIDILVRPAELGRARAALAEARYAEQRPTVRPSRSEWVRDGETHRVHSLELDHVENPWAVDLHVALERNYHRGLVASLGPHAFDVVPLEIAARPAQALAQPTLVAWLALHTGYGLDHLQLARLMELVLVMRKDAAAGGLSWDGLTALLEETGTTRFAYPALALAEHLAPGTVPRGVIQRGARASSVRARRVVEGVMASGSYRLAHRSLDEKLMWSRGPVQVLCALSELAWPGDHSGFPAVARVQLRRVRALLARQVRLRGGAHGR